MNPEKNEEGGNNRAPLINTIRKIFNDFKPTGARSGNFKGEMDPEFLLVKGLQEMGHCMLYELKDEVFTLFNHPNIDLRAAVINVFAAFKSPEFLDACYERFLNDDDLSVRNTALRAWAKYYPG
jgi:hypothetical protein